LKRKKIEKIQRGNDVDRGEIEERSPGEKKKKIEKEENTKRQRLKLRGLPKNEKKGRESKTRKNKQKIFGPRNLSQKNHWPREAYRASWEGNAS